MKSTLHSFLPTAAGIAVLLTGATTVHSATVITDNFDTGVISAGWDTSAGSTIIAGGAQGSTNAVSLASGTGALGESFIPSTPAGAEDFILDYYFRIQTSAAGRQFSLIISTNSATPNVNSAALNLRYQTGAWAAFSSTANAFTTIPGLPVVTADTWYHMQVEGVDWGTSAGSYTLRLSDAGGSAFTSTVSGLTFSQTAAGPDFKTNLGQSFVFNAAFGSNPGYSVDNISAFATAPVPEPAATALATVGVLGLLRRRR